MVEIGVDDEGATRTEADEREERKTEDFLDPLRFSLQGVEHLKRNVDTLKKKPELAAKFHELVVYHCEAVERRKDFADKVPPRALFALYESTELRKFLPTSLRERVKRVVDSQVKSAQKILTKECQNWTKTDVSKLCALYKHFQKQPESTKKDSPYNQIAAGLAQWVAQFFVDDVLKDSATTAQKVLILEINRILKGTKFALKVEFGGDKRTIDDHFSDLAKKLARDLLASKGNSPDVVLVWELLEHLDEELEGVFDATEKENLKKLVQHGNAARLLMFLNGKNPKVFSPMEHEALQEVFGAEGYGFEEKTEEQRKMEEEDQKKMAKFTEEQRKIDQEIASFLETLEEDNPLRENYKKAKEGVETTFSALWDVYEPVRVALTEMGEFEKKEITTVSKSEFEAKSFEDQMIFLEDLKSVVAKIKKDRIESISEQFQKLQEAFTPFNEAEKELNIAKEDIKNAGTESLKEKTKKLKESEEEWKKKKEEWEGGFNAEKELVGYFSDLGKKGKEIDEAYMTGLQKRVDSHELFSDDMRILLRDADPERALGKFRSKFGEVLEGDFKNELASIIDGPAGNKDQWIRDIEKYLNNKVVESFEAVGGKTEFFTPPQIDQELINGSLQHFRKEISEIMEAKLQSAGVSEEDQMQFFTQMREHFGVRGVGFVEETKGKYETFRARNKEAAEMITKAKKELDAVLVGIEDEEERNKLIKGFEIRCDQILRGKRTFDEKEFPLPGKEQLNNFNVQTTEWQKKAADIIQYFNNELGDIQKSFERGEEVDEARIKKFFERWNTESSFQLGLLIENMRAKYVELYGETKFVAIFFHECTWMKQAMDKHIQSFEEAFAAGGELSGKEPFFEELGKLFGTEGLGQYLNMGDSGLLRKMEREEDQVFAKFSETTARLKNWEFFEDREKARKNFQEVQDKYNAAYRKYQENLREIKTAVEADFKMKDEDFMTKYGSPKNLMQSMLDSYDKYDAYFGGMWNEIGNPAFWGQFLEDYDKESTRATAMDKLAEWEQIAKSVDDFGKYSDKAVKWIEENKKWDKDNKTMFGNVRKSKTKVIWFSLRAMYESIKNILETREKRRKRQTDKQMAELGMAIFGETSAYGKEFKRLARSSEKERIDEWKTAYENVAPWDVQKNMYESKDQDEVRACMEILMDKGFLQWDDPKLWEVLNRLQSATKFNFPGDQELTYNELQEKVKIACGAIWGEDVFRQWQTEFNSKIESAGKAHDTDFDNREFEGERTVVLQTMLQKWRRGEIKDVDPSKYEQFLKRAFTDGKMNGQPDQRWYFLVMGLTVKNPQGRTILSKDIFNRFQTLLQSVPHMEFFTDKTSPKKNGEIVPDGMGEERPWKQEDFEAWYKFLGGEGESTFDFSNENHPARPKATEFFYTYIRTSPIVQSRVSRMQNNSSGNIDHDDGAMFAADWSYTEINQALVLQSHAAGKYTPDFWRNALNSYDLLFKQEYSYIKRKDQEWGEDPAWEKARRKRLERVGDRLKAAFALTQSLLGNFQAEEKGVQTFDREGWEKETPYSRPAVPAKEKVFDFMGRVLDEAGRKSEFEQLFTARADEASFKSINSANLSLMQNSTNEVIFSDPDRIERALEGYVMANGGPNKFTETD